MFTKRQNSAKMYNVKLWELVFCRSESYRESSALERQITFMSDNINERESARVLKPTTLGIFVIIIAVGGGAYAATALGGILWLLIACALFAASVLLTDKPTAYIALPLAYGAAILLGASWIEAFFAISFALPGRLLAYIVKKRGKATHALVALAFAFAVCFAAYYAYAFYAEYGSVIGGARQFYADYKQLLIDQLTSADITAADGSLSALYTPEAIEATLATVVANLPGIISVYLALLASVTVIIMRFILRRLKVACEVIPDGFMVVLPRSWGIMFFVFGAAAMLLPDTGAYAMYRAAAVNLFMLFLGTLAAYGATVIIRRFRASKLVSTSKLVLCFVAIFIIAIAGVFVIAGASLYGALCAIFPPKRELSGRT